MNKNLVFENLAKLAVSVLNVVGVIYAIKSGLSQTVVILFGAALNYFILLTFGGD